MVQASLEKTSLAPVDNGNHTPAAPSSRMTGTKRKRGTSAPSSPRPSIISISSDSDYEPHEPKTNQASVSGWNKTAEWAARIGDDPTNPQIVLDTFGDNGPVNWHNEEPKQPLHAISLDAEEEVDTTPTLCKEQQDLVDLVASGRNVFYTGSAGCGKSTVLKAAVRRLKEMGRTVDIVAPTGRAALQVEGMSTWSYMGWTPDYHKFSLKDLISKGFRHHIKRRLTETEVLIIDEISMVENHHLERINACMKAVRCWKNKESAPAFGGVQVIVTGDFCQLPPVKPFQYCIKCGLEMKLDDYETEFNCSENHGPFLEKDKWAFQSAAWEEANFAYVHLKEIHRQNDEYFIKLLQKCRLGIPFSPEEVTSLMDHPCKVHKATRLLCTRREVNKVNIENFNKLKTTVYQYNTLDGFQWNREAHPQLGHFNDRFSDGTLIACKDQRLERQATLRKGMLVVLQVNLDLPGGLCNGSQGIICGFEDFDPAKLPGAKRKGEDLPTHQVIGGEHSELRERQVKKFMMAQRVRAWPRVLFHNGTKRTIYAWCVVNSVGDKEPYSLLYRTQVPLVAGWAMSIHKSQGMTLDRVIVDLSSAFEEGQVYVALSRATNLEGLKIEGSSEGLSVGNGGNNEVRMFLHDKFGEGLLQDHY
ncbi:hypothetical protein G7Z17_g3171 [Cylindrodendrum hubeiense]|uniref:ATP-dependent DNA helicase n=1 Tax=Cylindrodendrum hubeiense TaxID=595255 RepID=A0A9P5HHF2_9HYPO|nr:hypothetical protein G7Z17_g3171 [Cylindrodendrum hubeiense]